MVGPKTLDLEKKKMLQIIMVITTTFNLSDLNIKHKWFTQLLLEIQLNVTRFELGLLTLKAPWLNDMTSSANQNPIGA